MIKKIREYFVTIKQYREAKKTVTLMLLNQYSDFLEAQTNAMIAEEKAYKSMSIFSETFKPEDLKDIISNANTIANSPQLQTSYYEKVHKDAQKKTQKVVK